MELPQSLGVGAKTRLHNDRIRAARASMQNAAAQNTLRETHKSPNKRPVSSVDNVSLQAPSVSMGLAGMSSQPQVNLPVQAEPATDPVEIINNSIRMEKILGSPEMQQAVTKVKLRNAFQTGDMNTSKDGQPVGLSALSLMSRYIKD